MKISVCIPTYNGAKYIAECLQSVCNQTNADFEIIVCDDCSTDNTIEIVKAFQQTDSRIEYFVNERNLGLVGNWSRCIEKASNDWIKFVFQDDLIKNDCIQKFANAITPTAELIVCDREYVFEGNMSENTIRGYTQLKRMSHVFPNKSAGYISPEEFSCSMTDVVPDNFVGEPTAIMFNRRCINKYGGFNIDIINLLDLEFVLRIGTNEGLIYIPEELVQFRVHSSSASQTNLSLKLLAAEYSDRIALYYILLHDSRYANFRKHNTATALRKMKLLMYYKAHRALRFIRRHNDNAELLREFSELNERYKGINRFANNWLLFLPLDVYFSVTSRIYNYLNVRKFRNSVNAPKA